MRAQEYLVVAAPVDAIVKYLPDGYQSIYINGVKHLEYAGVRYLPVYQGTAVVFRVARVLS